MTLAEPLERRMLLAADLPKDLAGNTLADAMDLGTVTKSRPAIVEGLVHGNDRRDVFRFSLARAGRHTILLDDPGAGINLKIFDADGKRVDASNRPGAKDEFVTRRFAAGTYFARVTFAGTSEDATAGYTFKAFQGERSDAPAALPVSAAAAAPKGFAIFVDIDGIEGESEVTRYVGQTEALSYTFGLTSDPGTGTGRGNVVFNDVLITKMLDSTSPQLMLLAAEGKHIAEVVITLAAATGSQRKFMTYTLEDVVITQLDTAGTAGPKKKRPTESVRLAFEKIELEFQPAGSASPITAGWDVQANKAV